MFPMTNLNLKELYDSTVEYFAIRSPTNSLSPTGDSRSPTLLHDPGDTLPAQVPGMTLASIRRELHRTRLEVERLQGRCRELERALKDSKGVSQGKKSGGGRRFEKDVGWEDKGGRAFGRSPFSTVKEEEAENNISRVYLTRTDSWSGAQIMQAVQDLNSEILQFSASTSELCVFEPRKQTARYAQATKDTSTRLGPKVAQILSMRDHTQDPILVQLAIQGAIMSCLGRAMTSFCMGLPAKHDGILGQIYSHMCAEAPQPITAKWRSLTHHFVHVLYPYLAGYTTKELEESIYRWCLDIFIICGCNVEGELSRNGIRTRFGEQVRRIASTVYELARITREDIMSTSFEIVAVKSGAEYDSATMQDAFREYGVSGGGVLFTTEFGLKCTTGKELSDGRSEYDCCQLLFPSVVLDSVVGILDQ